MGKFVWLGFVLIAVLGIGVFVFKTAQDNEAKINSDIPPKWKVEKVVRERLNLAINARGYDTDVVLANTLKSINNWGLRGSLNTLKEVGGKPLFFAEINAKCDAWEDVSCWKLSALTVDGKPVVDLISSLSEKSAEIVINAPEPSHVEITNITKNEIAEKKDNTLNVPSIEQIEGSLWQSVSDRVNARSGPGKTFETIFKMPKQTILTLIKQENGWGQFEYLSQDGNPNRVWIGMQVVERIN